MDLSGDVLEGRSDEEVAEWVHRVQHEWTPRLMFLMVPVFAVFTALATRRQHRHFPQHLYFALHSHAAWFGFLSVAEAARFARQPALSSATTVGALVALMLYRRSLFKNSPGKLDAFRAAERWSACSIAALLIVVTVALFLAVCSTDLANKGGRVSTAGTSSRWSRCANPRQRSGLAG